MRIFQIQTVGHLNSLMLRYSFNHTSLVKFEIYNTLEWYNGVLLILSNRLEYANNKAPSDIKKRFKSQRQIFSINDQIQYCHIHQDYHQQLHNQKY